MEIAYKHEEIEQLKNLVRERYYLKSKWAVYVMGLELALFTVILIEVLRAKRGYIVQAVENPMLVDVVLYGSIALIAFFTLLAIKASRVCRLMDRKYAANLILVFEGGKVEKASKVVNVAKNKARLERYTYRLENGETLALWTKKPLAEGSEYSYAVIPKSMVMGVWGSSVNPIESEARFIKDIEESLGCFVR